MCSSTESETGFIFKDNVMNYQDQLKDPRWQKKRLEILQRDNFTCRICNSDKKTLHIHHTIYFKDKKAWEYHNFQLLTLCEDCHEAIDGWMKCAINELLRTIHFYGFIPEEIMALDALISENIPVVRFLIKQKIQEVSGQEDENE